MSHTIQDSIDQGLSWNFAEAMATSIDGSVPVFLGNDYYARHNYKLEIQECMQHLVAFHAEMMGAIMYLHQALKKHDSSEFA